MTDVLQAPHVLEFPYRRSLGPVLGAFFTALRDRQVLGIRDGQGRVIVPPQEHDPATAASLTVEDLVEVADVGTVVRWSWNPEPRPQQPLDHPFAWVQVLLDGADVPLLHALDISGRGEVESGMRVRVRWRTGEDGAVPPGITAIACFEPEEQP